MVASDLCELAASQFLNKIGYDLISGLVFVSQTPDYIIPPTNILLQDRLKLAKGLAAFDINNGCSPQQGVVAKLVYKPESCLA